MITDERMVLAWPEGVVVRGFVPAIEATETSGGDEDEECAKPSFAT